MDTNRFVTNRDVFTLINEDLGLTAMAGCYLLGIPQGRWNVISRDARTERRAHHAISRPTLAVLARWLNDHPRNQPDMYREIDTLEAYRTLRSATPFKLTKKAFGLLLGLHASAGHRWITQTRPPFPSVMRALEFVLSGTEKQISENWQKWIDYAILEARLRGCPDLIAEEKNWPVPHGPAPHTPSPIDRMPGSPYPLTHYLETHQCFACAQTS